MKAFISCRVFPEMLAKLKEVGFEVDAYPGDSITTGELLRRAGDADVLICPLSLKVDAGTIRRLPRLRAIGNLGVGVDNIDLVAANERRILVLNTPGVLTEAVADLAFGLLLAVARRIVELDRRLREEGFPGWSFIPPYPGAEVHGRTIGIVGLGRIGAAVARRGRGFGMRILYTSRTRKPEVERELGAEYRDLEELLMESDFVVVCVPLTPETHHLIGEGELSLMKRTAFLVNVARGPVVDEEALVHALKEGRIRGAALDVFEREPEVHPGLLELPNVVLTPHVGSATEETRRRMADLLVDGLAKLLRGERPENLVNPEVWPGKW